MVQRSVVLGLWLSASACVAAGAMPDLSTVEGLTQSDGGKLSLINTAGVTIEGTACPNVTIEQPAAISSRLDRSPRPSAGCPGGGMSWPP